MLRIALFVVPPLVGVMADATSLRAALLIMPAGAVLVVALSRTLSDGGR